MVAQYAAGDCSVILQTSSTREVVLCFAVDRNSTGLTQRVDANPGTFKVDKQTTLWSQCTGPLLPHTPSLAVYVGKPAADVWFCKALSVADMYVTTTLSPSFSISNTSRWSSRNVFTIRDASTSPLQRLYAQNGATPRQLHRMLVRPASCLCVRR